MSTSLQLIVFGKRLAFNLKVACMHYETSDPYPLNVQRSRFQTAIAFPKRLCLLILS